VAGNGRVDGGVQSWSSLKALPEPPTAVFCYNDMTAIGLLRAVRQAGLSVPQDLSVVGFDDIPFASFVSPSLTTIAQPQFEMGQRAMQMSLALMKKAPPDVPVSDVLIKGKLVVRESSGCPRVSTLN
jgi:DNA-binding LacI/PurR family transcriptional regulator